MDKYKFLEEVGRGAQHIVGRIPGGKLLKFPYWKGWWDKSTAETVRRDIEIHREVGNPIPETDVVEGIMADTGSKIYRPKYGMICEFVEGEEFREMHLEDAQKEEQLREILNRSVYIRKKYNSAVDFLGGEAFSQFIKYLLKEEKPGQLGAYNLIIDSAGLLRPIDTNLLSPERISLAVRWLIRRSMDTQHTVLACLLENQKLVQEVLFTNHSRFTTLCAQKIFAISRKIEAKRKKRYAGKQ